ncbi:MAG: hypothetical protein VX641_07130 [Planctomycetota bacterium]|nr:hypothetical protein [Planctomycetota bacterium]
MAPPPRDIVDIDGFREDPPEKPPKADAGKKAGGQRTFLSVHFTCCNTYGRLYPDAERTSYHGRCPKCGAEVQAKIGPGGTNRRIFDTQ